MPLPGQDPLNYVPPVWDTTGNEYLRDTPIPGRRSRGGTSPTFPNPSANARNTGQVILPSNYQLFQSQFQALILGQGILILSEPPNTRVYLEIKVSATSIGTLAVAINNQPNDLQHANWIVTPGGPPLVFPSVIPQNRIYGLAVGGVLDYVITYANLGALPTA